MSDVEWIYMVSVSQDPRYPNPVYDTWYGERLRDMIYGFLLGAGMGEVDAGRRAELLAAHVTRFKKEQVEPLPDGRSLHVSAHEKGATGS